MSTATKQQVTKFAEEHNIDWYVYSRRDGWDFSVELANHTADEDDAECGVMCGEIDREDTPTAAQMWYQILQEMKELVE